MKDFAFIPLLQQQAYRTTGIYNIFLLFSGLKVARLLPSPKAEKHKASIAPVYRIAGYVQIWCLMSFAYMPKRTALLLSIIAVRLMIRAGHMRQPELRFCACMPPKTRMNLSSIYIQRARSTQIPVQAYPIHLQKDNICIFTPMAKLNRKVRDLRLVIAKHPLVIQLLYPTLL